MSTYVFEPPQASMPMLETVHGTLGTAMARKIRDSKLESRSARLRLPIRKKPYTGPALARGIHLLYRRNRTNGTWVIKASNGHGGYWTRGIAAADALEERDGTAVLALPSAAAA